MPNGTELLNNPWETIFSPYTDLFETVFGNGHVFYLFPLTILTYGVYIKTQNSTMASMFMIASGLLLAGGNIFIGATHVAVAYTIFTAIGFVGLFTGLIFQRGGG